MYIKFSPIKNSFAAAVNYHFSKMEKGTAELTGTNIFTTDGGAGEIAREMEAVSALNNARNLKNIGWDISINFPPGERPDKEVLENLVDDVLNHFSFDNRPHVIFTHTDKDHFHVHVVASSIDLDGKHNTKMTGFYGKEAVKLSDMLENKYSLSKAGNIRVGEGQSLPAAQMREYSLHREFIRLTSAGAFTGTPIENRAVEICRNPMKNRELLKLINFVDPQTARFLVEEAKQTKTANPDLKQKIKKELTAIKKKYIEEGGGPHIEAWIKAVSGKGLYIRHVKNSNTFTYGIPNNGKTYYFSEKKLPQGFGTADFHTPGTKTDKNAGRDNERAGKLFIKKVVTNALRKSRNTAEFKDYLEKRGIYPVFHANRAGIYGISYTNTHEGKTVTYKGSQIGCSWERVNAELTSNASMGARYNEEKGRNVTMNIPALAGSGSTVKAAFTNTHRKEENEYDNIDFYGERKKGRGI